MAKVNLNTKERCKHARVRGMSIISVIRARDCVAETLYYIQQYQLKQSSSVVIVEECIWLRHSCFSSLFWSQFLLAPLMPRLAGTDQECQTDTSTLDQEMDNAFLQEKIFTQEENVADPFSRVHGGAPPKEQEGGIASMFQSVVKLLSLEKDEDKKDDESPESDMLNGLFQTARQLTYSSDKTRSHEELYGLFSGAFQQAIEMMKRSMELVWTSENRFHIFSFWYYLEYEDERKNPSWKRRKHRYHKQVDLDTLQELHNGLYLSQLSYADSVDDIRDGLAEFMNNTWELVYCRIEGLPREPAHFMAIKKETKVQDGIMFPWQMGTSYLDVMIVVRGTKELGDVLSDGLLETEDYRDGKAHSGIAESGAFLVNKHIETLEQVLEASGRDKIRLSLVGHSLGAGTAAIAAIEYNEYPLIEASSIGFGCPALLSLNLSQSAKDFVTTVVADSDIIPRMSGATFVNMLLDVTAYDFTSKALEDLHDFLVFVNASLPLDIPIDDIVANANSDMDRYDRPAFAKVTKERLPRVLYPPGTCIHLFRDGVGYTASYTPCDYFDSVDVTRTLLDDHMVIPGYHRAFLTMLRDRMKNLHFDFQHDIMALPVT